MHVWRICRERHVPDAFDGIGAEKYGGRWNHKGYRLVYTSTSLSLASLELFVHVEPHSMPDDLCAVVAHVADKATREELKISELPANWRDYPAPASLQDIGSQWIRETRSLLLIVPSAVNPEENNILINPAHSDFRTVTDIVSKPFHFDPRMWK